jgi:2-dehydropantoate 2-reductase
MRVAVVGPGAIGGLVGALLARAGHDVCCVARPATAAALNDRGLTIVSEMFGRFTVDVRAVTQLTEPADLCLIAVKAPDLPSAVAAVPREALGPGLVLPLLNGWEHLELLARHFGQDAVIGGAIRVEAMRRDATTIEHLSPFIRVTLGAHAASDGVAATLEGAGVTAEVGGDALASVWEKLTFLAPFALVTARWRVGIGRARERHRSELEALVSESTAVGATFGATSTPVELLRFIDALPPEMTSSLRRDLEARRSHELDAIGGGVVRAGRTAGIAVDAHLRLIAEIERAECDERAQRRH